MGEPQDLMQTVIIATVGGFMLNVMNLWEDSKKIKSDRTPKDSLYWFFFVGWPIFGGGLAYLYLLEGSSLKPILAFSVGLGAPTIIKNLMSTAAQPSAAPSDAE
jgi:hypothetical protein